VGGSEWVRSQKRLGAWRRKDWHELHESSYCYFKVYVGTRNLNCLQLVSRGQTLFRTDGKGLGHGHRGSHIDVAFGSVYDRDQNGIKRSPFFLGANQGIKTNSERLISTNQCPFSDTKQAWLRFVL